MPRGGPSRILQLCSVGIVAYLLATGRGRSHSPLKVVAAGGHDGAQFGETGHPRMGILVTAVAACILLAVATIGVLQMDQTREDHDVAVALTGGDPRRAADLTVRYGCAGCHTIPGVPGAHGEVAAPLASLRKRVYLAGVVPNTADNLLQWIVDPRSLSPRTAMPATGISRREAADVAAYLYAH
jgi:mono/diheme cytochrome c family protein